MRILVVDDDEIFREAVGKNLAAGGHAVQMAVNGKTALQILHERPMDLVISDIRMPEMDGVDLLKAIRSFSRIPVILMTGFAEIMETQTAHSLGADDFVAKPFTGEDLQRSIARFQQAVPARPDDPEEDFCKLAINDFITGRTIKFNIFVRLAPGKFIKIAHKGEDITLDRIRFYREKGLTHLYLRREDFRQYVGLSATLAKAAKGSSAVSLEKKLNLLRHTGEILNEHIRHDGLDDQAFESAHAFVGATLDVLTDSSAALAVLDALRSHSDHVLVHSVGVSMYSVMIAQTVEWNLPTNRFKVAMGGLFHDIGMKELSRDLIDRPRYAWSRDEVRTFETHPLRGNAILSDLDGIPEDVREVVKQHHENCLSRGYPSGLKRASIHPMAKLIAVADEFCYRTIKGPEFKDMTPVEALQDLRSNLAEHLDKRFLDALVQLFRSSSAAKAQAGA